MASKFFVIDANTLISSYRKYYSFDFAPAFWDQLIENGGSRIILVDKIRDEIYRNEDLLSEWLKANETSFMVKTSEDNKVIECYSKIITAVNQNEKYKASAKSAFASDPDSWLCAHALAYKYVVVTEETYDPNRRNKVKIPNVCREFDIEYIDLVGFIREIGIKFS